MRYGLSTLMLVVFAASILCGIWAHGSFVAFAIGFGSGAVLLINLMAKSGPRPIVVHESTSDAEAHLLRDLLVDHGIDARVEGSLASAAYPSLSRPRVVVPPSQLDQTRMVLQEFEDRSRSADAPQEADAADRPRSAELE